MEIQGKIIQVLPLQSGTGSNSGKAWKKQEYILETLDAQYPKKVCFNLWGDNVDKFAIQLGEDLTLQIDIESREFNGRWYTDVRAWRVDRGFVSLANPQPTGYAQPQPVAYAQPQPPVTPQPGYAAPAPAAPAFSREPADDLPF